MSASWGGVGVRKLEMGKYLPGNRIFRDAIDKRAHKTEIIMSVYHSIN
jgi:hypothetical protein